MRKKCVNVKKIWNSENWIFGNADNRNLGMCSMKSGNKKDNI
jgi:hypothetical protein